MPFFIVPAATRPVEAEELVSTRPSLGDFGAGVLRFGPVIQVQVHELKPGGSIFRFDRQLICHWQVLAGSLVMKAASGAHHTLSEGAAWSVQFGGGNTISWTNETDAPVLALEFQMMPPVLDLKPGFSSSSIKLPPGFSGWKEAVFTDYRVLTGVLTSFEQSELAISDAQNGYLFWIESGTVRIGGELAGPGDLVGVYGYDRIQFMPESPLRLAAIEVRME